MDTQPTSSIPQQWTPEPGEHVWYNKNDQGDGVRATVIEVDGDDILIHPQNGTEDLCVMLTDLEQILDRSKASPAFQVIVEAPPAEADPPPPGFILNKAQGLQAQVKTQADILKDFKQVASDLVTALAPILALDGDKETTLTPPLDGTPAPLVSQMYSNNSDLSRLNAKLRSIIAGVQL